MSATWDVDTDLTTGDYEIVVHSDNPEIVDDFEIGTVDRTALIGGDSSGLLDSLLDHTLVGGIPTVLIAAVGGLILYSRSN